MAFQMFFHLFPDIGLNETRSVVILPGTDEKLPPDEYGFLESYCNDPGCDCRRVYFNVITPTSSAPLAVISWGWEDLEFYRKWSKFSPDDISKERRGPILAPMAPTTPLSEPLLALFEEVLLQDPAFIERIKRHYAMFRKAVNKAPHVKKRKGSRSKGRR
jgi:hypothetical protein